MNYYLILFNPNYYNITAAIQSGQSIYWHNYNSKGYIIQKGDKVAITDGKRVLYKADVVNGGIIPNYMVNMGQITQPYSNFWNLQCDFFYQNNGFGFIELNNAMPINNGANVSSIRIKNSSIKKIGASLFNC